MLRLRPTYITRHTHFYAMEIQEEKIRQKHIRAAKLQTKFLNVTIT